MEINFKSKPEVKPKNGNDTYIHVLYILCIHLQDGWPLVYKGSVLEEVLQSNRMCASSNVDTNHLEGDGK